MKASGLLLSGTMKRERLRDRQKSGIFRKILRNQSTLPEILLWNALKGKQLGKKFRRQAGIGPYIVDFLCVERGLVIEVDGETHFTPNIHIYDDARTRYLESRGLRVLRFENREVAEQLDLVVETIKRYL